MARVVSGALCWVPDEKRAFVAGKVVDVKGSVVQIEYDATASPTEPEKKSFPADDVLYRPPGDRTYVSEMDDIEVLHMASVLDNVEMLFEQKQAAIPGQGPNIIYSSVGPVLIALNPFQQLPLYGPEWVKAYSEAGGDPVANRKLGPHAFRSAEEAFQGLRRTKVQSVVICGESGAGKTVTNRKMLEYLCEVAKKEGAAAGAADPAKITMANELLESFGNATTTRNDNSSRFGKLTSLHFDPTNNYSIAGCGVDHYLLERSRIIGAPEQERNYHIFYELLRSGEAEKYKLEPSPEKYAYSKEGAAIQMESINDKEDFAGLVQRMDKAGFDEASRTSVFEAIAAVLHLGNVKIKGDRDSSSVDPASESSMSLACGLLGVDAAKMNEALTTRTLKTRDGVSVLQIGTSHAEAQRDTVSKMIYSRTFDHIVTTIDRALSTRAAAGATPSDVATIGLLDIFGFEDMAINGFEQMFINLTNERIQHLFNTIMFDREKKVYEDEGIDASWILGPRNIECVELFTKVSRPPGIVQLLSDQCRTGQDDAKVDGEKFVSVLNRAYAQHRFFQVCNPQEVNKIAKKKGLNTKGGARLDYKECFGIVHYAGVVLYTVQNFVPKSRDTLFDHLGDVLRSSTKPAVQALFPEEDATGKATVGQKFRDQLEILADTLQRGETLFVRCIKSNPKKAPAYLDRGMVMEQLQRGGVIAALAMRAAGLPDRLDYKTFNLEFGLLERGKEQREPLARCQAICFDILGREAEDEHQIAFGRTRIFMKSGILSFLRAVVRFKTAVYARRLQSMLKGSRVRKIGQAWEGLLTAEARAKVRGIDTVKSVAAAIAKARAVLEPVHTALMDARKAQGIEEPDEPRGMQKFRLIVKRNFVRRRNPRASACMKCNGSGKMGLLGPKGLGLLKGKPCECCGGTGTIVLDPKALMGPAINYDLIIAALQPHKESLKILRSTADEVLAAVDTVERRQRRVEVAYNQRMSKAMESIISLMDRVAEVEAEAAEMADQADADEIKKCSEACAAAKASLEELRAKELPALKQRGFTGIDLDVELKEIPDTCPEVDKLVERGTNLVKTAEEVGFVVLKVRREFALAVEELEGARTAARARLEQLQEPARRCNAEGLQDISDFVDRAVGLNNEMDDILQQAKDPEAFRTKAGEFEAAVAAAKEAVDRGSEELARREKERAQRRRLLAQLDDVAALLDLGLARLEGVAVAGEAVAEDARMIREVTAEVPNCRQKAGEELEDFRAEVEDLSGRATKALNDLERHIEEEQKRRRESFGKRVQLFGGAKLNVKAPPPQARPRMETKVEQELSVEDFVNAQQLGDHQEVLLRIDQAVKAMKEAGVPRSKLQDCIKHFMEDIYKAPEPRVSAAIGRR